MCSSSTFVTAPRRSSSTANASANWSRRKAVRHDRVEVDAVPLEHAKDLRPRCGRVRAAPDHIHVSEHDPVGRKLDRLALSRDPQQDDATAGSHETGREIDRVDGAGRLQHEVEPAAGDAVRRCHRILVAHVHRRPGAELRGERRAPPSAYRKPREPRASRAAQASAPGSRASRCRSRRSSRPDEVGRARGLGERTRPARPARRSRTRPRRAAGGRRAAGPARTPRTRRRA